MQTSSSRIIYTVLFSLAILLGLSAWRNDKARYVSTDLPGRVERDIVYGSNVNYQGRRESMTMDVYYPPNLSAGKKYPMVMLIHGGTFLNGKKEDMAALCRQMADSGFVAITINYRLGWDYTTLGGGCATLDVNGLTLANYRAIQDAHAAMRFIAANADKYHVDKNWLFVGGGSAGAITALNVAYNTDKKILDESLAMTVAKLGSIDTASNAYTTKFKIKGICDLWGALSDSTLINKKTALPTIFYHGTADKLVPYDHGYYVPNCNRLHELFGSACLYRQTRAAGQIAVFNTSVGGKHGPEEFTAAVIASNTACFFHKVMNGTAMSAAYYDAMTGCR